MVLLMSIPGPLGVESLTECGCVQHAVFWPLQVRWHTDKHGAGHRGEQSVATGAGTNCLSNFMIKCTHSMMGQRYTVPW